LTTTKIQTRSQALEEACKSSDISQVKMKNDSDPFGKVRRNNKRIITLMQKRIRDLRNWNNLQQKRSGN
jgi:hypothetical protein